MSDLQDRLNALAERGTPRGFDAVIEDAVQEADVDLAAVADTGDDTNEAAPTQPDVIPFVTAEPPMPRRRRPFSSMIAAAGVTTMLLVGMLAVTAIVGSGGAGSPEAAVRQLADAVKHEDLLAASDVLAPSEVQSLHDTVDAAQRKAAELKLVNAASAPLVGVDLDVDNLDLVTEQLGPDHVKVTVTGGEFSARTEKAKFSPVMQKVLQNTDDNSTTVQLANIWQEQNLPSFVVAVKQDGDWYVSAAYTALEYLREYNQLPAAEYGAGARNVAKLGADTPEAAVEEGMRALAASDWEKLISLAPPSELPLYDYRAALVEYARQHDAHTAFTIDDLSATADVDGDTANVTLKASGTGENGDSWKVDGGCFTQSYPDDTDAPYTFCVGDRFNVLTSLGMVRTPRTEQGGAVNNIKAVRQGGRWFLSPVNTSLDVLNTWIQNADKRSIYTLLGIAQELPPDGTLTINEPTPLGNESVTTSRVFQFEGRAGQELLGEITPGDPYERTATVVLWDSNGKLVDEGKVPLGGQKVRLPADGTYRAVVTMYGVGGEKLSLTLWDAKQAPASAKKQTEMCSYTGPNSTGCFSSSAGSLDGVDGTLGTGSSSDSYGNFQVPESPAAGSETCVPVSGGEACSLTETPATTVPANTTPTSVAKLG